MNRSYLSAGAVSLVGALAVASVILPAPHALLAAAGLSMGFFVPGFALVTTLFPALSAAEERVLASVGISLVVATCAAVLLAATRIGLTRESFDITLGVAVICLSIIRVVFQQGHGSARTAKV